MTITTVDSLLGAMVGGTWRSYTKLYSGSSISGQLSLWAFNGNPSPGSLSIGDVVNGVVPTGATQGALQLPTVGTSYLSNVLFSVDNSSSAGPLKVMLYDRVWHAGSFSAVSSGNVGGWVGGTAISRPDATGTDVEAFLETNTAPSGVSNITLTYTDQAGNPGQTATASLSGGAGQVVPLVLGSGFGIRSIQTINSQSSMASGSYNIVLARRLVEVGDGPNITSPFQDADPFVTGLPIIPNGACIAGVGYNFSGITSFSYLLRLLIAQG